MSIQTSGCIAHRWWYDRMPVLNWRRTSWAILSNIETKILSCLKTVPECKYITIADGTRQIWTLSLNANNAENATKTPLVMLHGMGSGIALWVLNLEALARDRPVYAIDLLGFGRSSRVRFAADSERAEAEFVESIESWRQSVGLDKMILLGHSLGGYLAASYALQHADRIKHLILVDPWGFQERPPDVDNRPQPLWVRLVRSIMKHSNPFSPLRMAGPWGPSLVAKFKADLVQDFSEFFSDNRIADYLYHCNAQPPSGEIAFKSLTYSLGWAQRPMLQRICHVPSHVSMTFIHGSRSWVDSGIGREVKYRRTDSYVDFQLVNDAGHHVYADAPHEFNKLVSRTCALVDSATTDRNSLRKGVEVELKDKLNSSQQRTLSNNGNEDDPDDLNTFQSATS